MALTSVGTSVAGKLEEARLNDLSQAHEFATVAEYKSFTTAFPVGKVIHLLDRDAKFTVIAGTGTANTFNIIASTQVSQSIDLVVDGNVIASQFGTTATALQAVVDYAIANSFSIIGLDRLFDITGSTININKGIIHTEGGNDFARKRLTFVGSGVGEILKTDAGFMFSATARAGDISFDNVTFSGVIDNTGVPSVIVGLRCFDCDVLLRVSTTNCTFRYLDHCWYQEGTTATQMQSIKSVNDTYTKNNIILQFNNSWDIVFNGGLMEDGNQFLKANDLNSTTRNLIVNNGCTVEGMIKTAIELNCINIGTKIVNTYFEANQNHIQMNHFNNGANISDNTFLGRGNVDAGDLIRCIDVSVGSQALTVSGNVTSETTANTTLIFIDETSAFNVSRNNLMGSNGVTGSAVLTNVPNRYIDSADITNDTTRGVDFGITADVSGVQGGGLLTASVNEISTCANTGDSVTLLTAVSGLKQTIINNGANACDVFPNTGDNLGAGVNVQVSLAAGANITYQCYDFSTTWIALT